MQTPELQDVSCLSNALLKLLQSKSTLNSQSEADLQIGPSSDGDLSANRWASSSWPPRQHSAAEQPQQGDYHTAAPSGTAGQQHARPHDYSEAFPWSTYHQWSSDNTGKEAVLLCS